MTIASGLSAAGMYFAQPLLAVLRDALHMSATAAGLTVTAGQVGYAIGLALLVPLGDRVSRRGLAAALLAATSLSLLVAGCAPSGAVLLIATGLAAATAVGAQVLVPFAAELSAPDHRARNISVVMSGVLLGGLLGRAASGALADTLGWRTVYWFTAAALAIMAVLVVRMLPRTEPSDLPQPSLPHYLRSTALLLRDLPALRRPVAVAAATMAGYSVQLSALTMLLSEAPYHWGPGRIGMFGLVGVIGLASMTFAARIVDRGHIRTVLIAGVALELVAWTVMIPAGSGQLSWLVVGMVLINLGQTAMLNAAQSASYELRPDARGRINAVFMTLFFAAGAIGSAVTPTVWAHGHWPGVCFLGATTAGVALLLATLRSRQAATATPTTSAKRPAR
ncbi:MFS transporter [Nocardia callitridis]